MGFCPLKIINVRLGNCLWFFHFPVEPFIVLSRSRRRVDAGQHGFMANLVAQFPYSQNGYGFAMLLLTVNSQ